MMNWMTAIGLLGLGLTAAVAAELPVLSLDAAQIDRLGLQWTAPESVHEIPLGLVPAQVTVPPQAETVVSAPLAGLVEAVQVTRGESVTAGQAVARLNCPELLTHQQHFLDAWQEVQVAEARYAREKPLYSEGIIAKSRWLETRKTLRQTRTAFEQAREALALMGMRSNAIDRLLKTGRLDSVLALKAPATGVVTAREAVVGQRLERLMPLLTITGTEELWLEMAVPVAQAERLESGASVETDARVASGRVFLIGGAVDPETQTVLVRARLIDPKDLKPGRKLSVWLYESSADAVWKAPQAAVVEHQQQHYVFVRTPEGFRVRPVTLAGETAEAVFIREGLRKGELLVSRGVAALKAAWLGEEE